MNVDQYEGRFAGIGAPELRYDEELAWGQRDGLGIQQQVAV